MKQLFKELFTEEARNLTTTKQKAAYAYLLVSFILMMLMGSSDNMLAAFIALANLGIAAFVAHKYIPEF